MSTATNPNSADEPVSRQVLAERLKKRHETEASIRKGVCLLNAGQYEQATVIFLQASRTGITDVRLPSFLAACYLGRGKPASAGDEFGKVSGQERGAVVACIRKAHSLWVAGEQDKAISELREAVLEDPECAEIHFQLGTLLSSLGKSEEAELRFAQAANINRDHTDALVSLALCCGVRRAPHEAVKHLQQAQQCQPSNPRIGFLLAQAAAAVKQQGNSVLVHATMADQADMDDEQSIAELVTIIEHDTDFIEAFLAITPDQVDRDVFDILLLALEKALARNPEVAELHMYRSKILARLECVDDAIVAGERAVEINPKYVQALIELGTLYSKTDRTDQAITRLEQAMDAGAKYADVLVLLGDLRRQRGELNLAKNAYTEALEVNDNYQAAREALTSLPI